MIGGGDGGSNGGGGYMPPPPPTGLTYTSPVVANVSTALATLNPTVNGTVTAWTVAPALPAGLTLVSASTATGTYTDGTQVDLTSSVLWTSVDMAVATISNPRAAIMMGVTNNSPVHAH